MKSKTQINVGVHFWLIHNIAPVAQSVSALYLYDSMESKRCGGCEFEPHLGQKIFLFQVLNIKVMKSWARNNNDPNLSHALNVLTHAFYAFISFDENSKIEIIDSLL